MKIGWISIGNDNFGSTRIGVTNIHKALIRKKIISTVLHYNSSFNADILAEIPVLKKTIKNEKIDIIIFHKVCGSKALSLVDWCRDNKIKTIYANGDWHLNDMYGKVDAVVSGSSYTRDEIRRKYPVKCFDIDDALETCSYPLKKSNESSFLNLGWFGNFTKLECSRNFIKSLNIQNSKLHTISNAPCTYTTLQADVTMGAATSRPWDVDFLIKYFLENIDVCVIPPSPGNILENYAKTANRLTFAMSLGIPVVASPIPSYEEIVVSGINGFLCRTQEEWIRALNILKDPKKRRHIGKKDSFLIREKYSPDNIVNDWINVFNSF